MTNVHLTRRAVPASNILKFALPAHSAETNYDRALARQETQLRVALAKV
jgi:hypothetical protein